MNERLDYVNSHMYTCKYTHAHWAGSLFLVHIGKFFFFSIFLTSIVHYNLSEVEEHDLAELSHSMYSLLEAKDKFQLIFQ